jgi:hypothetical protein
VAPTSVDGAQTEEGTAGAGGSTNQGESPESGNNSTAEQSSQQHQQANSFQSLVNIDVNSLLLPTFSMGLSLCWYFRINFKNLFSPLSTLILVIFTFLFALFVVNNLQSTSALIANHVMMRDQFFQRRRQRRRLLQQQQQRAAAPPSPPSTPQDPASQSASTTVGVN